MWSPLKLYCAPGGGMIVAWKCSPKLYYFKHTDNEPPDTRLPSLIQVDEVNLNSDFILKSLWFAPMS